MQGVNRETAHLALSEQSHVCLFNLYQKRSGLFIGHVQCFPIVRILRFFNSVLIAQCEETLWEPSLSNSV